MQLALQELGFDVVDECLYRKLLAQPRTASELATDVGSSLVRTADSLERLRGHGFALPDEVDDGEPRWLATPPDLALHLLASKMDLDLRSEMRRAARLRADAARLSQALLAVDDHAGMGAVQPRACALFEVNSVAGVRDAYRRVAGMARRSLRRFDPEPLLEDDLLEEVAEGVRVETLVPRAALDDAGVVNRLERRMLRGELIRIAPTLPAGLLVADRRLGIVGSGAWAAVVETTPVLDVVRELAERQWSHAIRFQPRATDADAVHCSFAVSPEDAQLLRLLAAGLKDQTIARHLGIGLRTVVRRIGRLSRDLDAETRFQLALQACKHRLI